MIHYQDDTLIIRDMLPTDGPRLCAAYVAQGWHDDEDGYRLRLADHIAGRCIALIAEAEGAPVGNLYLYREAEGGPFRGRGVPIVVDLSVLQKYQGRGIATRLMDTAEALARRWAGEICLGVGLSREYGRAQRIYTRRGYVPDGSGVWYRDEQCVQYETVCTVDDDLVIFLSKDLGS